MEWRCFAGWKQDAAWVSLKSSTPVDRQKRELAWFLPGFRRCQRMGSVVLLLVCNLASFNPAPACVRARLVPMQTVCASVFLPRGLRSTEVRSYRAQGGSQSHESNPCPGELMLISSAQNPLNEMCMHIRHGTLHRGFKNPHCPFVSCLPISGIFPLSMRISQHVFFFA